MPHVTVEYSANLESDVAPRAIVDAVHDAVLATGAFELGAARTRAARRDVYAVADRDPDNAFVAVAIAIGKGRDVETRRRVSRAVMDALEAITRDAFARRGLALSVEIREIDDVATLRTNNLHARMKAKAG
jgi:5-carboxymethyl-2-hydroxymuconate isomerase